MAGMYPDNQTINIFGEEVSWPGVGANGKFTNGSFSDPMVKPSFIPAETINLILDSLSGLIMALGKIPNNYSPDQLAIAITDVLNTKAPLQQTSEALEWLIAKLNGTSGHKHTGGADDAPQIQEEGIASNSVTVAKIADRAVTAVKLVEGSTPNSQMYIPNETDLNTLKTPGFFCFAGSSDGARTLLNTPWGVEASAAATSFTLIVYYYSGYTQVLYTRNNVVYRRYLYSSISGATWTEWIEEATLNSPIFTGVPKIGNNPVAVVASTGDTVGTLPIGCYILCEITNYADALTLNKGITVRRKDVTAYVYPGTDSNPLLEGTWRASGKVSDNCCLVRRIA